MNSRTQARSRCVRLRDEAGAAPPSSCPRVPGWGRGAGGSASAAGSSAGAAGSSTGDAGASAADPREGACSSFTPLVSHAHRTASSAIYQSRPQISHAIPFLSFPPTAHKPQNSNDLISRFERHARELHARFLGKHAGSDLGQTWAVGRPRVSVLPRRPRPHHKSHRHHTTPQATPPPRPAIIPGYIRRRPGPLNHPPRPGPHATSPHPRRTGPRPPLRWSP